MKIKFSKKLKFGSVALIFTAIVIAAAVIVNVIFTVLNKNSRLDFDMTANSLYTISDASVKLLDTNSIPVTVYFLEERDIANEDAVVSLMLNLVDSYAAKYSWINVEYLDITKRVDFKNKYTKSQNDALDSTSLVVDCEETGEYKVLTALEDYLLTETTIYNQKYATGFQGELALTSAILNVTTPDGLVACFETGHNESGADLLEDLLQMSGYDIVKQNLSEEEINPDTSLLIINNPKLDFVSASEDDGVKSEVEKLVDYMNLPGRNMLVFLSPTSPSLPGFEEFLAVFGVSIERSIVFDDDNAAAGTSGSGIYGILNAPEGTLASEIAMRIEDGYSPIFHASAPIDILFDSKNHITVTPIATTSKTAYYENADGEKKDGKANLLTVSTKELADGKSNLVLCSTANYNIYLDRSKFANRELMYSILQSFGAKNVTPDIAPKSFEDNAFNMSEKAARAWGMTVTFVPAAIILVIGLIVWNKRRHL